MWRLKAKTKNLNRRDDVLMFKISADISEHTTGGVNFIIFFSVVKALKNSFE